MVNTRRQFLQKGGVTVAGVGSLSLSSCLGEMMGSGGGKIKLGAINPLSGPAAYYGELATKAQSAWAKQVNEDGGIAMGDGKRKVNIVEYDDESKNSQARSAAKKLATADKVSMILSSWRSTGALAVKPIVNRNKIPAFTHGFTPKVNDPGTYVMRLTVSTVMDAYPALKLADSNSDIKNIGVIAEQGDWGNDTLKFMNWWFDQPNHKGTTKNLGRFSFDQQDFSSFITKAKQAYRNNNIDALYVQTWASAMQRFLKQQHREELYKEMPILTGLGGADFNSIDQVGAAMDNVYALCVYTRLSYADNPKVADSISKKALSQFKQYNDLDAPKHPVAYNVYADAQASKYALNQVGSTEGESLRNALVGNEFTTILGSAKINNKGQPSIPGSLIKFGAEGGKAVIDKVAWDDQLPPITNIPPKTEL